MNPNPIRTMSQHTASKIQNLHRHVVALCAIVVLLVAAVSSRAASGTWTNTATGGWSTAANWTNSIIADTAASTADFNSLDLTAQNTVTNDSARTIGTMIFGDADTNTPAGWLVSNGGVAGNTITATNITVNPIFAVNSEGATNDAIISAVIAGAGVVKSGAGTVNLTAANTFTSLQVDAGVAAIGVTAAAGANNRRVILNGGGIRVMTNNTYANTNFVLTTGHLYAPAANYDALNGPWIGSNSATMYVHATSGRFTFFNGVVASLTNFFGTIDLADSLAGLVRLNLGAGPYDCSAITFNLGTNSGRLAPRITTTPSTFKLGSLSGGPNTRLESSEQGTGTNTTWEIGALNTSTVFDGRIINYTGLAPRNGALKKVGSGRLTLTSPLNGYTGITTVSGGVLALSNSCTIASSSNITVLTGALLDVSGFTNGTWGLSVAQFLGGGGGVIGNVTVTNGTIAPGSNNVGTLSFTNNLVLNGTTSLTTNRFELTSPGTGDLVQVAGDLSFSGIVAMRVVPTGASIPDGTYTLMKWGGNLTGDTNNMAIEYPAQPGTFVLQTNLVAKEIRLVVSGVTPAATLVWKGDGAANDWDTATTNWLNGGSPSLFVNGDKVTFNDTGSNNVPVNLALNVNPGSLLVNATKDYTIASSGSFGIIGSTTLVKSNTGVLTVTADNSFSGGTLIAGGAVQIGDGAASSGSLGSGNVTNNATLIYNRPDTIGNVNLIVGSGSVVKVGANTLSIVGNNTYSGGTIVSNGTLSIGSYGTLGTGPLTMAGGTFLIVPTGNATTGVSNAITIAQNSTLQYSGGNSFACVTFGALTGTPGTSLTVTSTASSTFNRLRLYGNFTNSINLDLSVTKVQMAPYNAAGSQQYDGIISGPGLITQRGNGGIVLNNTNTFTGGTIFSQGSVGVGANSMYDSGNLISSPLGVGAAVLAQETGLGGNGTIYAFGGARTIGNAFNYDNATNGYTWIFAGTNDLTLTGPIELSGQIDAAGGVNRPFQVDNTGRTVLSGSINDSNLVCGLTKTGPGLLYLNGTNSYTGTTTVSNGTLGGTGVIVGPVVAVAGSTFAPGASIGTLTVSNDLTIGGDLLIEINKAGPQTNDYVVVSGVLTNSGTGTVTVTNQGAALVAGNSFKLFSKPVLNGAALTITPAPAAGLVWTNKLAVDGSIAVLSTNAGPVIATNRTNITMTASGGNLNMSWPADHIGWSLQAQTNTRAIGLNTNWITLPGYETTNVATIAISPANPTVFYRLFYLVP